MAVDKKISQLASGAPAQAGDEYVVARSGANYKLTLTNIAGNMPATTISSGNLTFSSTGQRITGDFTNATATNRLAFQTSTANNATRLMVLPSGTGIQSAINFCDASNPTNCSAANISVNGATDMRLQSTIFGTGTYLPMTFYTGGSERMRLDTSGNLGIGTTSPRSKLDVSGSIYTSWSDTNFIGMQFGNDPSDYRLGLLPVSSQRDLQIYCKSTDGFGVSGITFHTGSTPSERMRISASGNVGIGGTAGASNKTNITGTFPASGGASIGCNVNGTIPSGATSFGFSYQSNTSVENASFTLANWAHFAAYQGTKGASATVTNQFGVYVDSGLTGATNNYGFYSNIASGSNRWNFYAAGTASNYMAGPLGVNGGATDATFRFVTAACRSSFAANNETYALGVRYASSTGIYYIGATNSATPDLVFSQNGGAERMRITNDGNVGIGTTPSSSVRFDIYGRTSAAGSYTVAFRNSSATNLFYIEDHGTIFTGVAANSPYNLTTGSAANVFVDSGGALYRSTSSLRYKSDVTNATHGLADVLKLRSVTYKATNSGDTVFGGLIAEEVHDAGLTEFVAYDKEGRPDALHYGNMVALLVKAVQELKAELDALKAV